MKFSEVDNPSPKPISEAGFFCSAFVGLRAVLLLIVLEGHYWFEATGDPRLNVLTFAVPCFFVLSGYLISHTLFHYERRPWKQAAGTFYLRRALRILPPFYLVLLLAHLTYGVPFLAWQAAYLMNVKLFILSAFEPGAFFAFVIGGRLEALHFWSIDVEEQFYLLYPLLILATRQGGRTLCLLAAIGICIASRCALYRDWHATYYGGLPIVAGEYILWGCLLAWADHRGRLLILRGRGPMYISLGLFAGLAIQDKSYGSWAQWKPPCHATIYAMLLAVFILALRYAPGSLLARFLSAKPLVPIGKVSYGAYLVHLFLNPAVDQVLFWMPWLKVFPQCPRAVAGPLVTLAVATIMWHGLERPLDSWRQKARPKDERVDGPVPSPLDSLQDLSLPGR
jgi:peptidoglycan/LPS O-acetylase OafA/YrhL